MRLVGGRVDLHCGEGCPKADLPDALLFGRKKAPIPSDSPRITILGYRYNGQLAKKNIPGLPARLHECLVANLSTS